MSKTLRGLPAVTAGVLLAAVLVVSYAGQSAEADHQPADKVAISASTVDVIAPGATVEVLHETMKVSSPSDLILQLTAECDILTEVITGGTTMDSASAFGQVEMWITIDGTMVPVSSTEDDGSVVFCNRAHEQEVTDTENDDDGTDTTRTSIQTRQANAFNWLAFNTGSTYDDPANGNNILDLVVFARFTETEVNRATAEAIVGARSLIVEPTKTSNHETAAPGEETSPSATGNGKGPNK